MELANELVALAAGVGVVAVIGLALFATAIIIIDTMIMIFKDWRGGNSDVH